MNNKKQKTVDQKTLSNSNGPSDNTKKVIQQNIVTVDAVYQTFPPKQKLATLANMLAWCGGQLMDLAQNEIPVVTMSQEVSSDNQTK